MPGAEVIKSAGLQGVLTSTAASPKRDAIRLIRAALRNQAASDDEVDDALEALVELAKE